MAIEVAARTAEMFLDRKGYEVLGLAGEPEDWCLVARDGDGELAFVAVDFRADSSAGFPEENLGKGVRRRMERLSMAWLAEREAPDGRIRFDTLAIVALDGRRFFVRHRIDAFCLG